MKLKKKIAKLKKAIRVVKSTNINRTFISAALADEKMVNGEHLENFLFSVLWRATENVDPRAVDKYTLYSVVSAITASSDDVVDGVHPWVLFEEEPAEFEEIERWSFSFGGSDPIWEGYW